MAQTGRPICTIPVGLVAAFGVAELPKTRQLGLPCSANPENSISVGQATDLSHTGGSAVPVGVAAPKNRKFVKSTKVGKRQKLPIKIISNPAQT